MLIQISYRKIMYKKALSLAIRAHKNQMRHDGQVYVFHPWRVANVHHWEDEIRCIAILHDIVEDTPIRLSDLRRLGFSERVIRGVDSMSRRIGEEYKPYIRRLAENDDAVIIKYCDIFDNMPTCEENLRERYEWTLKYLSK
jgi:(p)ppGpp synthase/HD superfamily hydrolase